MKNYAINKVRFVALNSNIVRIEIGEKFSNKNTFFIPNLTSFSGFEFDLKQEQDLLKFQIKDYLVCIDKNASDFSSLKVLYKNDEVYKYKRIKNSGELPTVNKTPYVFPIIDSPRIFLPSYGYSKKSFDNNERFIVEENVKDLYLILCDKDFRKLRKSYIELTGQIELPRLSTLGYWNSRYYAYTQQEAMGMILKHEAYNLPLDVLVIDTDWRQQVSNDGTGYNVNEKLFPDMYGFFKFAHEHNVEIIFNDHPLPVDGAKNVFSKKEVIYREKNLKEKLFNGLDYWWYDRNWTCKLKSVSKNITPETLGDYIFHDITSNAFKTLSNNDQIFKRPIIMCNVDDIHNGKYESISNTANHRYSLQWTGDIDSEYNDLANEIRNLIKCSNNGIIFYSSDLGGHVGNPDKETYLRWAQYGAFSPIDRMHCTKNVARYREPWNYDEETVDVARKFVNMRLSLLNYIYSNSYKSYQTLEPLCKPLAFNYPNDSKTYKLDNEYLFGDNILFTSFKSFPVLNVTNKNYIDKVKATFYNGKELKGKPLLIKTYQKVDFALKGNRLEKELPIYDFSAVFETKLKFDKDVILSICADDGVRVYVDGELKLDDWSMHASMNFPVCKLNKNKEYEIKIEYFQAGGEACLSLFYSLDKNIGKKKIYLPKDKWMDVNDGKVYQGPKTITKEHPIDQAGIFIKLGSLLPLYRKVDKTSLMSLDKITYDYYPDKLSSDSGFIYEDDYTTTAYKYGINRISEYNCKYNQTDKAYCINFKASKDNLHDDKKYRFVNFKINLVKGMEKIKEIYINEEKVDFKTHNRNKLAHPFNGGDYSCCNKTITFKFKQFLSNDYFIKIIHQ